MPTPASVYIKINSSDLEDLFGWHENHNDEYLIFEKNNSYIKLQKFNYPQTYCHKNDMELILGYILATSSDDPKNEFKVTVKNKKLEIITDYRAELQLFYYQSNNIFYSSDNFIELIKIIPRNEYPSLHINSIIHYLSMQDILPKETILKNTYLLKENKILTFCKEFINEKSYYPIKRLLQIQSHTHSIEKALKTFDQYLDNEIETLVNFSENIKIGSELSGGIDSAILSHKLLQKTKTKKTNFFSIILPDPQKTCQLESINEFIRTFGGDAYFINGDDLDLLPDSSKNINNFLNPYYEPYWTLFEKISSLNKGIDVIITGLGADELFSFIKKDKKITFRKRNHEKFNHLLTQKYQQSKENRMVFNNKIDSIIPKFMSDSIFYRSGIYRQHNIWLHCPYYSPKLISFALSLNKNIFDNKKILKEYMIKYNFPINFINNKKESFKPIFVEKIADIIKYKLFSLLKNSILFKLEVINLNYLFTEIKSKKISKYIYRIIKIEYFLQNYKNI